MAHLLIHRFSRRTGARVRKTRSSRRACRAGKRSRRSGRPAAPPIARRLLRETTATTPSRPPHAHQYSLRLDATSTTHRYLCSLYRSTHAIVSWIPFDCICSCILAHVVGTLYTVIHKRLTRRYECKRYLNSGGLHVASTQRCLTVQWCSRMLYYREFTSTWKCLDPRDTDL